MSKVVFFCIPAHGHTNPTIEVVRELTHSGHEVRYYSFDEFKKKIESAGAQYISCDAFLPPAPKDLYKKMGRDFSALIDMVTKTTIALDDYVCSALQELKPDCIVSDSACFWGKLFARKLNIPFVCSTTTFAFNKQTAKLMKPGIKEMLSMITGMPKINQNMAVLRGHGYPVNNFVDIIQNDNDTNTIVYTSKEFQPMAETFSDKYAFVGPSIAKQKAFSEAPSEISETAASTGTAMRDAASDPSVTVSDATAPSRKPLIYISLGTVLNRNSRFYHNCIEALKDYDARVIMSVGNDTDIASLGEIPAHFEVKPRVDQIQVLSEADIFVTHCGMNSANESIYCGVPMVLFPQHSEQGAVANRIAELKMGVHLRSNRANHIREAVQMVLQNESYRKNTEKLAASFRQAGGAVKAVDMIEKVITAS